MTDIVLTPAVHVASAHSRVQPDTPNLILWGARRPL